MDTSTRVSQMEAYHKAYEEASAQDKPVAYIRYLASEARVWFAAAEGTTSLEYFKSLREVRAAQKMRELMLEAQIPKVPKVGESYRRKSGVFGGTVGEVVRMVGDCFVVRFHTTDECYYDVDQFYDCFDDLQTNKENG